MKKLILGILVTFGFMCCQDTETINTEFTGNETVYVLSRGSDYAVSGSVIIKEKADRTAFIEVALSGTEDGSEHPAHLHLGDISTPAAEVAALLNPVDGKSGLSETHLTQLADESPITYSQLVGLKASIKIHLASTGPDRDIILAGGNIGQAAASDFTVGTGIKSCKNE